MIEQSPGSSLVAGVMWIQGALLGTAATSIAVTCVAGVAFQFLTGRIPARRAATVVLGCFILFGAPGIAAALSVLAGREPSGGPVKQAPPPTQEVVRMPQPPSRPAPNPFDPYPG